MLKLNAVKMVKRLKDLLRTDDMNPVFDECIYHLVTKGRTKERLLSIVVQDLDEEDTLQNYSGAEVMTHSQGSTIITSTVRAENLDAEILGNHLIHDISTGDDNHIMAIMLHSKNKSSVIHRGVIKNDELIQNIAKWMEGGAIPLFWYCFDAADDEPAYNNLYFAESEAVFEDMFTDHDDANVTAVDMMKLMTKLPGTDCLAHKDYTGAVTQVGFTSNTVPGRKKQGVDIGRMLYNLTAYQSADDTSPHTYDDIINIISDMLGPQNGNYMLLSLDVINKSCHELKDPPKSLCTNTVTLSNMYSFPGNESTVRIVVKDGPMSGTDELFRVLHFLDEHPDGGAEVHIVIMTGAESNETRVFCVNQSEDGERTVVGRENSRALTDAIDLLECNEGVIPLFWYTEYNRITTDPAMDTGNDVLTLYMAKNRDVIRQIIGDKKK